MTIERLEQAIEAGLEDGNVVIDSTMMPAEESSDMFDRVLGSDRLAIKDATLARKEDDFTLTGTCSLFGSDKVEVRIVFHAGPDGDLSLHLKSEPSVSWVAAKVFGALRDSGLGQVKLAGPELVIAYRNEATTLPAIRMRGGLPDIGLSDVKVTQIWKSEVCTFSWHAPDRLEIPGVPWLSIQNFNLVLEAHSSAGTVTGAVGCEIHAGEFVLPLAMTLPSGGDALQLRGDFEPIALPGFSAIAALLGTDAFEGSVPSALQDLGGFSISDFEILLNPRTGAVPFISLDLQSSQSWHAIPNVLALGELGLHFTVLSPTTRDRALTGTVSGRATIAGLDVFLSGDFDDELVLFGIFREASLSQLAQALLEGFYLPSGLADIALRDTTISISTSGRFSLTSAVDLDFRELAKALAVPVPDSLASLSLDTLTLDIDGGDKSWTLSLSTEQTFALGADPSFQLAVSHPTLTLASTKQSGSTVDVAFEITGSARSSDDVSVTLNKLSCHWRSGSGEWDVAGEARAEIYSKPYDLTAAIKKSGDTSTFQLTYEGAIDLCDWEGVGRAQLKALSFALSSETNGKGDGSSKQSNGQAFAVSGDVLIAIDHLFETAGYLEIEKSGEASRLLIAAEAPKIAPIGLPAGVLHIEAERLLLAYAKGDGEQKASWTLGGAAGIWFTDVPAVVQRYFPAERIDGSLRIGSEGVELAATVPEQLQPDLPPLALTFANDYRLELGQPGVEIEIIRVALGKGRQELGADLHVVVPPELNYLLGWDEQGRPNQVFLEEGFDLRLSLAKQPTLMLRTSPFKELELYEKNGKTWSDWVFGTFASFSFQTPELSFANGRWQGSAAMERRGPLRLPLTPVKFVLAQLGLAGIGDSLPADIELQEIDLNSTDFDRQIRSVLGPDALGQLDPALTGLLSETVELIEQGVHSLPTDFQDYLTVKVPDSLAVEFAVGGGATTFSIATEDDEPLKLLLPAMSSLGPTLFGFTFKRISLGQMLGGSLAVLELDGHIDQFDLPMLLGAPALPDKAGLPLRNRFTCKDVLAVAPTGLPIPIPLFYEELGWDLKSVVGLELGSHWSYPKPEPSIFGLITLFDQLKDFFTKPDYLLHEQDPPEGLKLNFTVGQNFITLPAYLGGARLGSLEPQPALDVYQSTARLLDAMKTGNAGYLIEAIPLRYGDRWIRIGREEIRFGPLVIGMSWCITTDKEFVDVVIPASQEHGQLPVAFDDAVLESLPTEAGEAAFQKGFIVLLMGHAALGSIVGMRTEFGIAVTGQGGFETGFRMAGEIGRALSLRLSGAIQADDKGVTVKGSTGLYWKDQPLIASSGRIAVSETALEVEVRIELTPFFNVEGTLVIGNQGLLMSGNAAWGHGADGPDKGIGASIQFARDGMTIGFDWRLLSLDGQVVIRVPGEGDRGLFTAMVVLKPDMALQESFGGDITSIAKSTAQGAVDKVYQDLQDAIGAVESLEISVAGLRDWLPKLCDSIIANITSTINANTTGWKRLGRGAAHRTARPYIRRLETLRDVARNASDKTIRPRLEAALQAIVDHNRLDISVGIPSVRWKKGRWGIRYPVKYTRRVSVYGRDLMDAKQVGDLKKAIDWIDALPDKEGTKIEVQQIYDRFPDRDKLLAEINRDIDKGVDGAVPRIESIDFETSLELLNIDNLKVRVTYLRGDTPLVAHATLDLSDPVKTTQQLIEAFGTR